MHELQGIPHIVHDHNPFLKHSIRSRTEHHTDTRAEKDTATAGSPTTENRRQRNRHRHDNHHHHPIVCRRNHPAYRIRKEEKSCTHRIHAQKEILTNFENI
jgi:hypothetical protein